MSKKSRMGPEDANQSAFRIVQQLTGQEPNPVKAKAGRAGGLKGGVARKEALSPERRSEIAKAAAAKRWGKNTG